jgi:hypothetical protein
MVRSAAPSSTRAGVRHPPVAESPTLPSRAPVVWWDSQGAWGKARIAKCYLLVRWLLSAQLPAVSLVCETLSS